MYLSRSLLAMAGAALAVTATSGVAYAADAPPTPTAANVGGPTHGGGSSGGTAATFNYYTGPTTNLTRIANSIQFQHKSVTAAVIVPAGLAPTNPVEVSVLFGDRRITQSYNSTLGLQLVHDFPDNAGARRSENVLVNLTEQTPTGAIPFHFTQPLPIDPLYDVTLSPLTFRLLSDCHVIGDTEPQIIWRDSTGDHDQTVSLGVGDIRQINRFAQHYTEVDLAHGLRKPGLIWMDRGDLPIPGTGFDGTPNPRDEGPLLPDTNRAVHFTRDAENDGFCLGEFSYQQTITLHTYPHF